MRTTVRLDDGLLEDAKKFAAERDKTLGEVIEEALRERIIRAAAQTNSPPVDLPVFRGGQGPTPGVDLDDNASVREFLDEGVPPEERR